jgi:hypothetical protein
MITERIIFPNNDKTFYQFNGALSAGVPLRDMLMVKPFPLTGSWYAWDVQTLP